MVVRAAMIDRRLVPARAVAAGQRRRRRSRSAKKTRHGGRVRKHLPRARDAVRAVARVGRDSRCDGRPTARRARHTGSARVGFLRERAVRMVLDHECEHDSQWAATRSIAAKIGCSARILCHWVRLAATLIAAAGLTVSVAEAGDEVYLRAGIDLDRPADTRFTDRDCASTVPAALYGCGRGPDGAPHGSVGAFGTVPTVEVGLGYAATAAVRLEAMLEYHPRFHFAGQTNFLEAGLQQSAAADLLSLPGLMATYLDLPGLGLSSVGPFDPCIGAGVGAVRNRIGEMHMTFPRTTTFVPGASHVDVVWMVTAGVAMALGEHVTLDVAWRYTDAGTVHTGRGGEVAMIRLCGAPHNWIKPTHPRCPWVTCGWRITTQPAIR